MRLILLLFMSVITLLGCTSGHQNGYVDYEDYPVYTGPWNEMTYTPAETRFSLWAPTASEVRVMLYDNGSEGSMYRMIHMEPAEDGMWNARVTEDLKGKFYAFNVKINEVWQGDTPGLMARAVGVNGNRAAILDLRTTDPKGWESDRRPPLKHFSDIIIYEMHHRDFSIDTVAGIRHRGKYLALTEDSTHTYWGDKTGISHLKELGITHVHLLPSFDFSSVDESKPDKPQYNWGYDPKNYQVPEGSYATDPFTPDVRIREFKQMVMALHQAGIRVIMDVVFNHTAQTQGSNFERTVPGYFYRHDENGNFADGSGCGNETASERPMMRRFMIETVCYWAREYHIDGFRFDLMGLHDIETMNRIRKALTQIDPTIFIYGEGWSAKEPQLPRKQLAMKVNTSHMPGIAVFSDEFRDSLRGTCRDESKGAFIVGRFGYEGGVRFGLAGAIRHPQLTSNAGKRYVRPWAQQPAQMISYVSCHDDLCITDRLKKTLPGASVQELSALIKLTETAVFTSQGVPCLFAGDEIMRDKHGVSNSYNSPDSINAIDWRLKYTHRDVFDYIKGLIALRKAHPAFRLGDADLVRKHLEFLHVPATNVVAFRLKGRPNGDPWLNTIVILNARTDPATVNIPAGKYWIAARDGRIDLVLGLGNLVGNQAVVSPRSALIIHQ